MYLRGKRMILYTDDQFKRCVAAWKNADSVNDAVDDIFDILGIDSDCANIAGPAWCEFTRKIVDAASSSDESPEAAPHDCTEGCTCTSRPPNVERMYELATSIADTYARKNADYGDSFHTSVQKYGLIAALTRMSDKWNRLENLMLHGNGQVNESITDTLIDLAAYALMTVMEIE
jgi:hypothetical protein